MKILDLGASFTKIHAELFSPLTNLEYLFLQFNEVGRLSSRNGITKNFSFFSAPLRLSCFTLDFSNAYR